MANVAATEAEAVARLRQQLEFMQSMLRGLPAGTLLPQALDMAIKDRSEETLRQLGKALRLEGAGAARFVAAFVDMCRATLRMEGADRRVASAACWAALTKVRLTKLGGCDLAALHALEVFFDEAARVDSRKRKRESSAAQHSRKRGRKRSRERSRERSCSRERDENKQAPSSGEEFGKSDAE